MGYRAVLFDFDYTLGDATDSIVEGYCHGFEKLGLSRPDREAVRRTVGMTLENGYTAITGDADPARQAAFAEGFREVVRPEQQARMTKLFPGAGELLRSLYAAGVRTGIVTTKRSATLEGVLRRFDLLEVLDYTVGGEQVKASKPDPEGLNKGIRALGVEKREVLYCGDTTIDAETAQNAGVDFCAVLNGTTFAEAFEPYPSVHIAPDLWDLKDWLGI